MGARFRSVLVVVIILVVAIILIIIGYGYDWTGFNVYTVTVKSNPTGGTTLPTNFTVYLPSKTLYDWLQLLFIPVVLAIAGFWFNHRERKAAELRVENEREIEQDHLEADREIALNNQHEDLLQAYLDKMSELLLHEDLRNSESNTEVRNIARVRTLTVLSQLDGARKRTVIQFLSESNLFGIISLRSADLTDANLRYANMKGANLFNVNCSRADLFKAKLSECDLQNAYFNNSNLVDADLHSSNLSKAEVEPLLWSP